MPEDSRPVDAPPVFSATLVKASRAAIGVVGFGTLLYGIGFVSISAHYWGLGIWPGSIESQEVTEEGGRFLYHLLFLPSSLLAHVGWVEAGVLLVVLPAVVALEPKVRGWFSPGRPPTTNLSMLGRALRAFLLAAAVLVSAILVETMWRTLQIADLLYTHDPDLISFRSEANRSGLYVQILWRLIAVSGIAIFLWYRAWLRVGRTERLLIWAQWLLACAALGAWPMAYGKLVISDMRPLILDAASKSPREDRLLVRKEGKNCFIWNKSQQRLEILSLGENQTLVIGAKEHLLE